MVDESDFQEQLDRLEGVLHSLGAPVAELFRPGLTDEQIDDLMAPTGLTLPDELRIWWRWHDGANEAASDQEEGRRLGPGGWLHLSLRQAVDLHGYHNGRYREMIEIEAMDLAELAWRPNLFPFSHRGWQPNHVLAADTSVPKHASAPVVMTSEMGIESWTGADSVSEVVGLWIELLESGRYHVEDGSWQPLDPMYTEEPRFLWLL